MTSAHPYYQQTSLHRIKLEPYAYDDDLTPTSISGDHFSIFQEPSHLKQHSPPLSPISGFRHFPLMPLLESQMPRMGLRDIALSSAPQPDGFVSVVGPATPGLSDHRTTSRPASEGDASQHNSPFTPKSTYDADCPTGPQMAEHPHETSYPEMTYPECYDGYPVQRSSESYNPVMPDDHLSTVSPHLLQEGQAHTNAYYAQHHVGPANVSFHGENPPSSYIPTYELAEDPYVDEDASGESVYDDDDETPDAKSPENKDTSEATRASASTGPPKHTSNRHSAARRSLPSRSGHECRTCGLPFETDTRLKKHIRKDHEQPYLCIFRRFGCEEVFGTKNEWARHVRVQHLRLETWRCDNDSCGQHGTGQDSLPQGAKHTNDYGRKDLFLEHVKRIHKNIYNGEPGREQGKPHLDRLQKRARITLRSPPRSTSCPCCNISWTDFDAWLEHVAKEMETHPGRFNSFCDNELQRWMIHEKLLEPQGRNKWRLEGATRSRGRVVRSQKTQRRDGFARATESHPRRVAPRHEHKEAVRRSKRRQDQDTLPALVPSQPSLGS